MDLSHHDGKLPWALQQSTIWKVLMGTKSSSPNTWEQHPWCVRNGGVMGCLPHPLDMPHCCFPRAASLQVAAKQLLHRLPSRWPVQPHRPRPLVSNAALKGKAAYSFCQHIFSGHLNPLGCFSFIIDVKCTITCVLMQCVLCTGSAVSSTLHNASPEFLTDDRRASLSWASWAS